MVETQRASGLSKLTLGEESVAPESSAAPFAARLRIARWCNPGWRLSRNRVRLLAGRLNCLLRRKSIQSSRKRRGTRIQNAPTRSFTPGYSQPCRKRSGTALGWHRWFGQACSTLRLYHALNMLDW